MNSAVSAPGTGDKVDVETSSSAGNKLGQLTVFGNWRFRTEAWDWFQPTAGQNAYAFSHSLLFLGLRQENKSFEWLVEAAQDTILGLPNNAVVPGVQGQLGLGGAYFAANGNENNASGFVKQAYVGFNLPWRGKVLVGRFGFADGWEVTPNDHSVADLVRTRIAERLIGEFTFSAVQRSFDGVQVAFGAGNSNFTFLAARPTEGVYQVDAMGEVDVNLFYGAFNLPITYRAGAGELRIFALGYVDQRASVLKVDNRPIATRTADTQPIRIGTYGADYVHVFNPRRSGQFDFLLWGVFQNGNWGAQRQRSGAFVGELGWQLPESGLKSRLSAGYSFGSGDSDPTDNVHGTFFQVLPTPRLYARFPFYNMENNEDFYGAGVFHLPHSLMVRSELHALRLASAQDLWYSGGGVYQSKTFGYIGRPSGGNRSLANVWDAGFDFPLRYGFSITMYYGHAWGNNVIVNVYPAGRNAQFGYVESNLRF
jgi:hypothetical protein